MLGGMLPLNWLSLRYLHFTDRRDNISSKKVSKCEEHVYRDSKLLSWPMLDGMLPFNWFMSRLLYGSRGRNEFQFFIVITIALKDLQHLQISELSNTWWNASTQLITCKSPASAQKKLVKIIYLKIMESLLKKHTVIANNQVAKCLMECFHSSPCQKETYIAKYIWILWLHKEISNL